MAGAGYGPLSIIGLLVHDKPGVMMKITGMFARRGFNIASITVGHSEKAGLSRITIAADGDEATIEQIIKQLNKLVDVIKVQHFRPENTTIRECALIKVVYKDHIVLQEITTIIDLYRAKAVDVSEKFITIEVVGGPQKITSFIEVIGDIAPIKELVRSGLMGIPKGRTTISLD
ncbi:MAG: acetolactate synthase small subunit [Promethearchaeota archaeon]